jgi:hypothetical protein
LRIDGRLAVAAAVVCVRRHERGERPAEAAGSGRLRHFGDEAVGVAGPLPHVLLWVALGDGRGFCRGQAEPVGLIDPLVLPGIGIDRLGLGAGAGQRCGCADLPRGGGPERAVEAVGEVWREGDRNPAGVRATADAVAGADRRVRNPSRKILDRLEHLAGVAIGPDEPALRGDGLDLVGDAADRPGAGDGVGNVARLFGGGD